MPRRTVSYSDMYVEKSLNVAGSAFYVDSISSGASFSGVVGIGQAAGTEYLEVNGNAKTKGIIINDAGSDLTPSIRFSGSTNTGLYNQGSGASASLKIVTNGATRATISNSALDVVAGVIQTNNDTTDATGSSAASIITKGGVYVAKKLLIDGDINVNSSNKVNIAAATGTMTTSGVILGSYGNAAAPMYSFSSSTGTGMWGAANTVYTATNGATRTTLTDTALTIASGVIQTNNDTTDASSSTAASVVHKGGVYVAKKLLIDGDINVNSSNKVNIAAATGTMTTSGVILGSYGSAAAPMYSFSSSTGTGMWGAANTVYTATNGATRTTVTDVGLGVGVSPTACLHIKAGTSAASTAPLKLTSGTLLATPEVGAIEFLTDKYYGTITSSTLRKEINFKPMKYTMYVCTDNTMGDFTTIKAAVDWFNSNSTADTLIMVDGGQHQVANTIVVNNPTYVLNISGLGGVGGTSIIATSALNNSPIFNIKSTCNITRVSIDGAAATGTCNGIVFDTTPNLYSEITDFVIANCATAILDTIGVSIFLFDFIISYCTNGVAQNYTTSMSSPTSIDTEVGNFQNCTTGINLIKGTLCNFIIYSVVFISCTNCVLYDGANYLLGGICNIMNSSYDNTGTFVNGFDFTRTDKRDADVIIISNVGVENNKPHVKINVADGTTTTTITAAGTYYKLNGVNSKAYVAFNAAATAGSYTITIGGQTTASLLFSSTAATIQTAINNLSNVTSVSVVQMVANKEWTIEFLTSGEGWVDMPISYNISGLTGPTSYTVSNSYYTCKWAVTNNRITYQSHHTADCIMWTNGSILCNKAGRTSTVGIKKNGTGNIINPLAVYIASGNVPYVFAICTYLERVQLNDYFEVFTTSSNSGDIITLRTLMWMTTSN